MAQLVVITGPIGAGKSTVAAGLAERFSAAGRSAVTVDLDDVVAMLTAPPELFEASWARARRAHGALVSAWLRSGVDAVIAHGPIYTSADTAALLADVPSTLIPRRVMLLVPFDVALERVSDDSARGVSRDPEFLRSTHERYDELVGDIPTCEWVFDTTLIAAADIVDALTQALMSPRGINEPRQATAPEGRT